MADLTKHFDINQKPTLSDWIGAQGAAGRKVMLSADQAMELGNYIAFLEEACGQIDEVKESLKAGKESAENLASLTQAQELKIRKMWYCLTATMFYLSFSIFA